MNFVGKSNIFGECIVIINIIEEKKEYIIVTSPVLVPYQKDCEYEYGEKPLTESEINSLSSGFLDWMIVDLEHEFLYNGRVIGTVLKSHVTTEPTIVKFIDGTPREYPAGTWFVTVKITDPDVIQGIKNEHYTGVSATTIERKDAEKLKQLLNSSFNVSTKSKIKRIF